MAVAIFRRKSVATVIAKAYSGECRWASEFRLDPSRKCVIRVSKSKKNSVAIDP